MWPSFLLFEPRLYMFCLNLSIRNVTEVRMTSCYVIRSMSYSTRKMFSEIDADNVACTSQQFRRKQLARKDRRNEQSKLLLPNRLNLEKSTIATAFAHSFDCPFIFRQQNGFSPKPEWLWKDVGSLLDWTMNQISITVSELSVNWIKIVCICSITSDQIKANVDKSTS